ncbi:anthranilate phosphoribosyltransferase [Cohnella thailandensis]|uniref:Anthranilate phosphoribosyltransferase n=1 Tax=Cohnella thailandensis TaxID=557557 RepID=A0A841STI7_9BACL|nr:anthranilate phosphoribosyltransferase [Cohnella thailandensis]MBB6632947.1 anthranilate phosphoribosyltransferase [Cohnella thailandensis]MBP1975360.1 anthranilate phosphoribosyltransferase [Cohnella thailandensis]
MINLLKEVARGKRGARDLTYDEALEAADSILTLKATPAQIGAFFIAERIKMESVEELEAFVQIVRKYAERSPIQEGLDCAGPYDGRKSSFYATFPAAFLLAAAGVPVTLHGAASLPPKWGIGLHDVIRATGINPDELNAEKAALAAREAGVVYIPTEQWCPPLGKLRQIREELGMRTILNSAEKLIDFTHSPYLAFGVYHNTVFDRLSRLIIKLGYRKALIVQGAEGSEDLFIDRPTRAYVVENGEFHLRIYDPETLGLDTPVPEKEWTPAEQVAVAEAVLRGEADMAFANQVLLNAAARLELAEQVGSLEEGLYTCKALIDNGAALAVYNSWMDALLGAPRPA